MHWSLPFLLFFVCILAFSSLVYASEDAAADGTGSDSSGALSDAALQGMRVKALQALLDERGVECTDCVEKADIIARVKELMHLPIVPAEERPSARRQKGGKTQTQPRPEKKEPNPTDIFGSESGDSAAAADGSATDTAAESSDSASGSSEPFGQFPPELRDAIRKKQAEEREIIEKLRAAGINVDAEMLGNSFGGFSKFAKNAKKSEKKKPPRGPAPKRTASEARHDPNEPEEKIEL
jgi:hypothetical protein